MELYHYSKYKLREILTLEEQWARNIRNIPEKDSEKVFDYHKHISLTIDPIPVKLILEKFPPESPYKRGGVLYEHVIEVDDIKNMLFFNVVETTIDLEVFDLWWESKLRRLTGEKEVADKVVDWVQNIVKNVLNEKGTTIAQLNKSISPYKGTIEQKYIEWTKHPWFSSESKRMYSPTIPHVMVYLHPGILNPKSVKQVI